MRIPGNAQQLEARRRGAIVLLRAGQTYRKVAHRLKASLSSVVRWFQAYRKRGLKGLRPKPTPGRPPELSCSEKNELKRLLLKGPLDEDYSTNLWTLKRIARLIEENFGVRYHPGHVWHILVEDLHWSWQKPERRARERDEEAIEHWKRVTWPRIKKYRRTWGPPRVRR